MQHQKMLSVSVNIVHKKAPSPHIFVFARSAGKSEAPLLFIIQIISCYIAGANLLCSESKLMEPASTSVNLPTTHSTLGTPLYSALPSPCARVLEVFAKEDSSGLLLALQQMTSYIMSLGLWDMAILPNWLSTDRVAHALLVCAQE